MKPENSLVSRLELRPSRTAQVKDAARAMKRAYGSVRERNALARTPRWAVLGATLLGLLVPAANAASAQAAEPPKWKLTVTPDANYFVPGPLDEQAYYTIEAENVGGEPTSGQITIEDIPPEGLSAEAVHFYDDEIGFGGGSEPNPDDLSEPAHGMCPSNLQCVYPSGPLAASVPQTLKPGQRLVMQVRVGVPENFSGSIVDLAKVHGGGAKAGAASATSEVAAEPPFAIHDFSAPLTDEAAQPYTQAGGHPYQLTTEVNLATKTLPSEGTGWGRSGIAPVRDPKTISAELPPGLIGNPQAVPICSLADFFANVCPLKTAVGTVGIRAFGLSQGGFRVMTALYNLQPTGAYPGELGYVFGFDFLLTAGLRSGSDYGLTIASAGIPEIGLQRARVTTWGVPADPSHDKLRGKTCFGSNWTRKFVQSIEKIERDCEVDTTGDPGGPAEVPPTPFLTMPTRCTGEPLAFDVRSTSWQAPGEEATATYESRDGEGNPIGVDGCNQLKFEPTIEARPTTNLADAPSGFDFNLEVPQGCWQPESAPDYETLCQADLKEAAVTLPPGLVVNPSSGAGLEGCSPSQIGLKTAVGETPAHFTEEPAHCPDAAKLGTVEVNTPLLHNPLLGSVYLATPHQNPSGNLLAGYIVLEGEGIIVKLAGQFKTNPQTGQITASFTENPQTPFEEFKFHFFEGARGSLRTPAVCGTYKTTSVLTPYSAPESGPPAEPSAEFETSVGAGGGSCANSASEEPNKPAFHAGTESPQAAAYSPFSLKLVRQDGEQEIKAIDTTLPPGLVGKLAGVGECSDAQLAAAEHHSGTAEKQSPSCPLNSEVGTVDVAAGAGPTPLNVSGKAYLAGPYKGAPLSLAIITPAVAGPFDLGTVVVRTALYVNPETAQIHAVSDPIPTILEGIPLDVRSVEVAMERPSFTLNPTSCDEMSFTGSATSVLGQLAPLTERFQVGGCPALGFKPKLKLSLKGGTKRAQNPALKAVLTAKPGEANIASAQVTLPKSEFLDNAHIQTVCTRVQFAANQCPAQSIYGHARAITPLLDKPLEGPVYLRSSSHKLPDLVAALNGQINVDLAGRIDTGKGGGIRNTFEVVPDAPVTKFTLEMQGGNKGLLENTGGVCAKPQHAVVDFTGQNGKTYDTTPVVQNSCKTSKHGKGHKKHKGKKK